jgi:tetratricopeptide (TPR) repeat protein
LSRAYLGVALRARGRLAEARDELDAVRPGGSESAIALQARGTLAFRLGDFALAERCSRAALAREPGMVLAHLYLGRALINVGRFSEGREVLLRASELADIRASQARWCEQAIALCESYLRQEGTPRRVLAPIAYADYLRYQGRDADATEAYQRWLMWRIWWRRPPGFRRAGTAHRPISFVCRHFRGGQCSPDGAYQGRLWPSPPDTPHEPQRFAKVAVSL